MNNETVERNNRILIIDDNRAIHGDFRKILQPASPERDALDAAEDSLFGLPPRQSKMCAYDLVSAYQGEEGVEVAGAAVAAGKPFAVAFVDMRMPPGWDGLETIEKLWQQQEDLQVVLCTAYSDYSLEEIQSRIQVSDRLLILKKPFDTVEALQFANALTEKWRLRRLSQFATADLQRLVDEHTAYLREANTLLREQTHFIDLARDSISVRALDGRVLFWNQGSEGVYGYSAAEAVGQCIQTLVHGDETQGYEKALQTTLANEEWTGELPAYTKRKVKIISDNRWTLLRNEAGEPEKILVISSDITAQKKLESQFLRAQRLESIGTLASGVAHDLNNILSPILVAASLLKCELPAEVRDRYLTTIESGARRGADIVRQVLTFARGEEGEKVRLLPTHLLKEMGGIMQETFPKDIHLSVICPKQVWPVEGDPTQLHQVLLNLCVNARDAMPNGGELTLSAGNLAVDEQFAAMMPGAKPGPHVVIEVRDTGAGIAREVIDRIFDPFFTTKEAGHGTGLGLSTSLGIVKSHGGFINVSSELGQGATFHVYLPASPEKAHEKLPPEEEGPAPDGNGERVLVVDDEMGIREITKVILERSGYQVIVAADGAEALAIFAQRADEIQLVLTDLVMPFIDGLTLIRTLRKMSTGLPIVASTGRKDDRHLLELAALDVQVCLEKPYGNNGLLQALHQTLGNRPPNT